MKPTWTVPAVVTRVIDGDTIGVQLDLGWRIYYTTSVRLEGFDAPEIRTPAGRAAREFAAALAYPGMPVTVRSRALDKYGRVLGSIILPDAADFAQQMIAAGHVAR